MLSKDQLIKEISQTLGKTKVLKMCRILKEQHFSLRDIIDITFHTDKVIAFRAAWMLETILVQDPESYPDELEYLISRFKEVNNPSCMRHYTKIIMHMTDAHAPEPIRIKLQSIDMEPVVEQLFDWMIDPKVKVAVKSFAGKALFNLKDKFPWIEEELASQLEFLMRDGSAGMQAGGKKILKEIKK